MNHCPGCPQIFTCVSAGRCALPPSLPADAATFGPLPNPKVARAVADGKAPLDYLEPACDAGEARVLKGGADKYGRRNYRDTEMLWTTYLGSMRRHLNALALGEDIDPESGEHHLSHIRANAAVLQGAAAAGTLVDDRTTATSTPRSDAVHRDGDQQAKALCVERADDEGPPRVGLLSGRVVGVCPEDGDPCADSGYCQTMCRKRCGLV